MGFYEHYLKLLKEDFKITRKNYCRVVVAICRLRVYVYHYFPIPILKQLFKFMINVVYFLYVMQICHVEYSHEADVGPGLGIFHARNIIVCKGTYGKNIEIGHEVTIACGQREGVTGSLIMGDNVMLSVGSRVLGPVTIGNHVVVGANAIVFQDVEDHMVVLNRVEVRPYTPRVPAGE